MVKGAVKTSEYLFHGSEYAKQHIVPEGARIVDPKVQAGLETAKWVSTGACRVSGRQYQYREHLIYMSLS